MFTPHRQRRFDFLFVQKQREQPRFFYVLVCVMVLVSLYSDLDWLSASGTSQPAPLTEQDVASSLGLSEMSPLGNMVWFIIMANCVVKLYLIFNTTRLTDVGRDQIQAALWKRALYFCPPLSLQPPSSLSELHSTVQTRIIAIQWLQLVCSVGMLVLTLVVYIQMGWSPHFNINAPFWPLKVTLLLKGCSGLVVFLGILRNTHFSDFIAEFGCRACRKNVRTQQQPQESIIGQKNDNQGERVKINGDFICFNLVVKGLDFFIGILVWMGLLYILQLGGKSSQPKSVSTILGWVVAFQLVTDVWVMVLGFFIHW
jgi:hypothetical protein